MSASAARGLRWWPARWRPARLRPIGLQSRIALLVSSGLLALITLFVVLGLAALNESTDRALQGRVALAQTAAQHLDFVLGQAAEMATWTASELAPAMGAGDGAAAATVLGGAGRRFGGLAQGLLLFGPSGNLLQTEPPAADLGYPVPGATVRESLGSGQRWAIDWARSGDRTVAVALAPVVGEGGTGLGYLGVAIDLTESTLGHWLQQMAIGGTGQVELVDSRGRLLFGTAAGESPAPEGHTGYYSDLMADMKPTVITCYDCHATPGGPSRQRDIMAFAPLKTADWGIVLRQSEEELLEPTRRLQQQFVGLGAISLLVALFVVWITTRSVVRPIRALTASARGIAEGDWRAPVEVEGSDEVAELSRALDHMRSRLERSLEEIRGCNAELDRRVRERTAELEQSRDELEGSRNHLQNLIGRLSILNAMALSLNQPLDLQTILDGTLANALKLVGMQAGAVYLVDRHTGELELAAHHGLSREAAQVAANLGLSANLCAAAAQAGEVLVVEDTTKYARGSRSMLRSEKMRCMVRVPFGSSGALLGTLCLGNPTSCALSKEDVELLLSVSNQVAVAVQNARLYEELQRKERMRGKLLRKVITAQEEERKRIARELHDHTSQALAALALAVEMASAQAAEGGDVSASLARMRSLAVETLDEVHRMIFDLRPTLLDDLGLIAAMRWYAETRLGEEGIKMRLEVAGEERRLAPQVETALYRVVQEAVNNVANHSGAQSFTMTLVLKTDSLSLTMMDDGWGFDMAELAKSTDRKRGLGLMGMKERVELLGGILSIYSELGGGTKITLEVPLREGEDDNDD